MSPFEDEDCAKFGDELFLGGEQLLGDEPEEMPSIDGKWHFHDIWCLCAFYALFWAELAFLTMPIEFLGSKLIDMTPAPALRNYDVMMT